MDEYDAFSNEYLDLNDPRSWNQLRTDPLRYSRPSGTLSGRVRLRESASQVYHLSQWPTIPVGSMLRHTYHGMRNYLVFVVLRMRTFSPLWGILVHANQRTKSWNTSNHEGRLRWLYVRSMQSCSERFQYQRLLGISAGELAVLNGPVTRQWMFADDIIITITLLVLESDWRQTNGSEGCYLFRDLRVGTWDTCCFTSRKKNYFGKPWGSGPYSPILSTIAQFLMKDLFSSPSPVWYV